MKFKEWLILEKFISEDSHFCELCKTPVTPISIKFNPRHVYKYGQLHSCQCGKSKIWANAIRNVEKLIDHFQGSGNRYYQGFCNDPYCGFCITKYLYPLKNGVPSPLPHIRNNLDLWGCSECDNQHILVDGHQEHHEGDTGHIYNWYKNHIQELMEIVKKYDT